MTPRIGTGGGIPGPDKREVLRNLDLRIHRRGRTGFTREYFDFFLLLENSIMNYLLCGAALFPATARPARIFLIFFLDFAGTFSGF